MAFLLSRTNVPIISLGMVIDDSFTPGDTSAYGAIWVVPYRQARLSGTPLNGIVRIASNMATRVFDPPPTIESTLQHITTLSQEFDSLQVWVDTSLPPDSVMIS